MAPSRRKQKTAHRGNNPAGDPASHSRLRHIRDHLEDIGPVLEACRDENGEIDWDEVSEQTRALIVEIEGSLIDQMAPHDVFDIVGNMLLFNLPIDVEAYRESEHEGQLANVEYAAALCLRRSSRRGTSDNRDPAGVGRHVEVWNRDFKRLLRLRGLGQMAGLGRETSEFARVRYEQFSRELIVRNPAYEWQEQEHLGGLFGTHAVQTDLERVVGFNIDDALKLADVCTDWIIEALARGANDVLDEVDGLRRLIAAQRAGEPVPAPSDKSGEKVAELARLSDHELEEMLHAFRAWSAWNALGDRSSFTVHELATVAQVDEQVALSFLGLFSQPLGQHMPSDPMRAIQAVRARPIMHDGDRYQCVDGGALLWAIRDRIEEALKPDAAAWNRYDRRRSTWTELRSLELLAGVLQPDVQYHSLHWSVEGERYQLDGLLLLDRYAITVEVKAGGFTEPARRAAPGRLERDLQKLIADAHQQARRARDALTSGAAFTDNTGNLVHIDPVRVQTVLPMVITLDELGVSPRIWELARGGILEAGEQHPTTMGMSELEVVCDVLDSPSRLLHYLTRRQSFNQIGGVVAIEEADLMMYYLNQGLYVEGENDGGVTVLPSLTDPLDAYYLHEQGIRNSPEPKPSVQLHPELESLIKGLEVYRPRGWTATACFLLDLAGDEQQRLGKRIQVMRRGSRRKHVPHDVTIAIDNSTRGLTVVTEPAGDHGQLKEYVRTLSFKNKHMSRATSWSGIGIHATREGPFHFHLYDATPWEHDEELDNAIAAWSELHEQRAGSKRSRTGT